MVFTYYEDVLHVQYVCACVCECSGTLDKQTAKGSTALHYCCLTDNSECMKLLLRGKASGTISKSSYNMLL